MRNAERWRPTKYVLRDGRLRPSRDPQQLGRGSRWVAGLQAEAYQRALVAYARGRMLDVGAGAAPLYGVYGPLVDEVTCIDWGEAGHDDSYLDAHVDLSGTLPFNDQSFDTILCTDVLEHLEDPELLLRECSRLLRPGGVLIVSVPFMYWLHEEPHDHHRYTEHRLRGLAERAGLGVEALEVLGGGVDVVIDIVAKHVARSRVLVGVWNALAPAVSRAIHRVDTRGEAKRRMPLAYLAILRPRVRDSSTRAPGI